MILLIAVGSASIDAQLAMAAASPVVALDRGDILPLAARDPRPLPPVVKGEPEVIVEAAGNWNLIRRAVTGNNAGHDPALTNRERTCVALSGAATTNAISGDRLPRLQVIGGAGAGSHGPSLQTVLADRKSRGRWKGQSERSAGAALDRFVEPFRRAISPRRRVNGSGELDTPALKPARAKCHTNADWTSSRESVFFWPLGLASGWLRCRRDSRERPAQDNPHGEEGACERRVHAGVTPCVGSTARRSPNPSNAMSALAGWRGRKQQIRFQELIAA